MLAKLSQTVSLPQNVKLYRSIGDILIRGNSLERVEQMAAAAQQALHKAEVEMAPKKCEGLSRELKFLSTWWTGGSVVILPYILRKWNICKCPILKESNSSLWIL